MTQPRQYFKNVFKAHIWLLFRGNTLPYIKVRLVCIKPNSEPMMGVVVNKIWPQF